MSGNPQIKLAAVKIGDFLKYSTSINEINRIASSVFNFNCESFPIEGISSLRAKLIFDWLMSLFKQSIKDTDKRALAKAFLTNITPENERSQIFQVLVDTGIMEAEPRPSEAVPASDASPETELLKHIFQPDIFAKLPLHSALNAALVDRMRDAQKCIEVKANLAAVILSGSVLEGMCLGFGCRHPERVIRAYSDFYKKPQKPFPDWKLKEWINVLGHLRVLSPNIEKFGQALRDFRNYVHPAEQLAHGFSPDERTARIAFQVVVAAAEDLVQADSEFSKVTKS